MFDRENDEFYGVHVDDWHNDGDPIFNVDPEDYNYATNRDPETTFKFNDDRLNKIFRNSNYRPDICIWLRREDDNNKKYKFVKPRSKRRQKNEESENDNE